MTDCHHTPMLPPSCTKKEEQYQHNMNDITTQTTRTTQHEQHNTTNTKPNHTTDEVHAPTTQPPQQGKTTT